MISLQGILHNRTEWHHSRAYCPTKQSGIIAGHIAQNKTEWHHSRAYYRKWNIMTSLVGILQTTEQSDTTHEQFTANGTSHVGIVTMKQSDITRAITTDNGTEWHHSWAYNRQWNRVTSLVGILQTMEQSDITRGHIIQTMEQSDITQAITTDNGTEWHHSWAYNTDNGTEWHQSWAYNTDNGTEWHHSWAYNTDNGTEWHHSWAYNTDNGTEWHHSSHHYIQWNTVTSLVGFTTKEQSDITLAIISDNGRKWHHSWPLVHTFEQSDKNHSRPSVHTMEKSDITRLQHNKGSQRRYPGLVCSLRCQVNIHMYHCLRANRH